MSEIERRFLQRESDKDNAPTLPDFLSLRDGKVLVGLNEDADVTRELLTFLKQQGKRMPEDDTLPSFLKEENGRVLVIGDTEREDIDFRDEWELWLQSCPTASE